MGAPVMGTSGWSCLHCWFYFASLQKKIEKRNDHAPAHSIFSRANAGCYRLDHCCQWFNWGCHICKANQTRTSFYFCNWIDLLCLLVFLATFIFCYPDQECTLDQGVFNLYTGTCF